MSFRNPIVAGGGEIIRNDIHSEGYVEGSKGWALRKDGSAQTENLQVLDNLGADSGTFAELTVGGIDVKQSLIDLLTSHGLYPFTFDAIWSKSWSASGVVLSNSLYQGKTDNVSGNRRGIIGFDHAAIAAALVGKTVTKCELVIQCFTFQTRFTDHINAQVGTHDYTSEPASWNDSVVNQNRVAGPPQGIGQTSIVNLGTTIGGEFKSGVSKGLSIGPGPTDNVLYYAGFYGASTTEGNKPQLRIYAT